MLAAQEPDDDVADGRSTDSRISSARKPRARAGRGAGTQPPVADTHVGQALRSAYDQALSEDVPDDFLDLLGKLS